MVVIAAGKREKVGREAGWSTSAIDHVSPSGPRIWVLCQHVCAQRAGLTKHSTILNKTCSTLYKVSHTIAVVGLWLCTRLSNTGSALCRYSASDPADTAYAKAHCWITCRFDRDEASRQLSQGRTLFDGVRYQFPVPKESNILTRRYLSIRLDGAVTCAVSYLPVARPGQAVESSNLHASQCRALLQGSPFLGYGRRRRFDTASRIGAWSIRV
ncbi:hypothetical protein CONLIGDRAFT_285183 [Coniochaeta ligniaria NRRL 30616]|uniref:Uncharacterized protein n=1 Tax=Coniochaeta ligniaria NRRL 30616 TaxID=1408157 RepID=A0A1J7JBH1_9PEZI|nr:hypothetical protein CONLIGDRAFT_285183 [Coniochaeta ligniaria NRRL 30616]